MAVAERLGASSARPAWVQLVIGGSQYALPITAVVEVIGLAGLRPVTTPGWAGVLAYRDGTLPLADGAGLVGLTGAHRARGRGVVLRGPRALGFTVDAVPGLAAGPVSPPPHGAAWPTLAVGFLAAAERRTLVLDAERLWRWLWSGLAARPDGPGFQLRPLPPLSPSPSPPAFDQQEGPGGGSVDCRVGQDALARSAGTGRLAGGRVLVFRAGLEVDLAVPYEQVLEVGSLRAGRPLPGAPGQPTERLAWRGGLVPLVDLPSRLGARTPLTGQTVYVALDDRAVRVAALYVSEVLGSAVAGPPTPARPVSPVPTGWVRAAATLNGRPLLILDPAALVVP